MLESTRANFAQLNRVNNIVMMWILNSIHRSLAHIVLYVTSAVAVCADCETCFLLKVAHGYMNLMLVLALAPNALYSNSVIGYVLIL